MKLSNRAIKRIHQDMVLELCRDLELSERWVKDLIARNKPNGYLTTYRAVEIIRKGTGLPVSDILVDERKIARRRTKVQ
jgi:hypothetical protein